MPLTFHIIKRAQTRSTQYNLKDVVKVLNNLNLPYQEGGMIIKVTIHTLEQRRELESNLKLIHRNIFYRITMG